MKKQSGAVLVALAAIFAGTCVGCAPHVRPLVEVFPSGRRAYPWVLAAPVWTGPMDTAADALGRDADEWRQLNARQVWLAVYQRDDKPGRRLTARVFAFDDPSGAQAAFQHFQPAGAKAFDAGAGGCWTEFGVLFHWGRLVFDVFGDEVGLDSQMQAVNLVAVLEQRMRPKMLDDPR